MAGSTTNIDTVVQSQASKEVTINAFFDAASQAATYGRRASTCSGLTWGYYGGNVVRADGTRVEIANGTLTLTASATNYVVASRSTGAVSKSTATTNWNDTPNYWRLYSIVAGSATVTSYSDYRCIAEFSGGSKYQPLDDTLTALAAVVVAANKLIYATDVDTFSTCDLTAAARALLDDADAAAQRATLGLGSIATQSAASISITGGSISGLSAFAAPAVSFPSTQVPSADPNTLDDYEEGTFTAGVSFGGGTTGITYTSQSGRYVKIGRVVTFEIYLALSSKGSSTGAALITGLPFAANAASLPAVSIRPAAMTSGVGDSMLAAWIVSSSTTIRVDKYAAGAPVQLTDADFSATSSFVIGGHYSI